VLADAVHVLILVLPHRVQAWLSRGGGVGVHLCRWPLQPRLQQHTPLAIRWRVWGLHHSGRGCQAGPWLAVRLSCMAPARMGFLQLLEEYVRVLRAPSAVLGMCLVPCG
jgi:hypothetical protein